MELALYCPVYGYYEKEEDTPGRRGDYFTSVSVGSLFGELLALQFGDWLTELNDTGGEALSGSRTGNALTSPVSNAQIRSREESHHADQAPMTLGPLQIVEGGAHDGVLAKDILTWLCSQRPAVFESIQYCIVEPSDRRRNWQRQTLAEFLPRVRWFESLAELAGIDSGSGALANRSLIRGVIFSNELLDAMPVHRLGWDAERFVWFEWGVTFRNGGFEWTRLTEQQTEIPLREVAPGSNLQSQTEVGDSVNRLLAALPDGFTLEISPAANQWWSEAAGILESGKLVAIDYGLVENERFLPERTAGTLRAYHRHLPSLDVLAIPGEQDITAHVDFSALRRIGEAAGLKTEVLVTQEQFLTRIAGHIFNKEMPFVEWTPERTRQFQTLTHPDHLGHSFRFLVQSR
jgi:SAM-dependent MidA family methyltransferase